MVGKLNFHVELYYVNQKNTNERFNIPGKHKSGNTHISIIKKIKNLNLKELNTYVPECDSKFESRIFEETIEHVFGMKSVTMVSF